MNTLRVCFLVLIVAATTILVQGALMPTQNAAADVLRDLSHIPLLCTLMVISNGLIGMAVLWSKK